MPFKSVKQLKYLASQKPELFKKWKRKYGVSKKIRKGLSKDLNKALSQ